MNLKTFANALQERDRQFAAKMLAEFLESLQNGQFTVRGFLHELFREQLKPVRSINPVVPEGLAELIHQCLEPNALKRPERMSEVQGTLDRLADEAAAKLNDPGEIED